MPTWRRARSTVEDACPPLEEDEPDYSSMRTPLSALSIAKDAWDSLEKEGYFQQGVSELFMIQGSKFIRDLPFPHLTVKEDEKLLISVHFLRRQYLAARGDWKKAAKDLLDMARKNDCPEAYMELGRICISGMLENIERPVARHRVVLSLMEEAFYKFPRNVDVMCAYSRWMVVRPSASSRLPSLLRVLNAYVILTFVELVDPTRAGYEKAMLMLRVAEHTPQTLDRATDLILKASNKKFPPALVTFAKALQPEKFLIKIRTPWVSETVHDALIRDSFQVAADAGDTEAILEIGKMYALGLHGAQPNLGKAATYFAAAIRKGNIEAFAHLGLLFQTGMLRHAMKWKDHNKAIACYLTGVSLSCLVSTLRLAILVQSRLEARPSQASNVVNALRSSINQVTEGGSDQDSADKARFHFVLRLITYQKMYPPPSHSGDHNWEQLRCYIDRHDDIRNLLGMWLGQDTGAWE